MKYIGNYVVLKTLKILYVYERRNVQFIMFLSEKTGKIFASNPISRVREKLVQLHENDKYWRKYRRNQFSHGGDQPNQRK